MDGIGDKKILKDFGEYMELRDFTKKTVENYRSCITFYSKWLNKNNLQILSVQDMSDKKIIEGFLKYLRTEHTNGNGQPLSYARLCVYFSALNRLYDYLEYNDKVTYNIILKVRTHFLRQFKNGYVAAKRRIIPMSEMSLYLNSIMTIIDKIINVILVKTSCRRSELISMDVDDINWSLRAINIKERKFKKRTNTYVFFDEETERLLRMWLKRRKMYVKPGEKALFINQNGTRVTKNIVYDAVTRWASKYILPDGTKLHNAVSKRLDEHFSPHSLRHCNTTYLLKSGMPKDFVKEIRGDKRGEVIDIYNHISLEDLQQSYLACMPRFNV